MVLATDATSQFHEDAFSRCRITTAFGFTSVSALAAETIKVGVLHSLSGTMAISETALKETVLMAIDEINSKGGVLGKKLEPVVVDPASNWPLFAEKARQLLSKDKVAVTFGCWTSVSRKSVLPVYKELNGLLFYPVQYEGEELEYNVFYTGAAPNQQAIPAVEYLMSKDGGEAKRFVLLGTDYVYPRTTNKILRAFLKSKGVADADIMEEYTPFGHSDYQTIIAKIKKFSSEGKKTAVVSTINGDSNVPFYKELGNAGIKATEVPVVAFSVGEEELRGVDTKPLVGHLASWNYFMSLKNPVNDKFTKLYRAWAVKQKLPNADKAVTNDPMEATYVGVYMWKQAVEKAKSTDVDKVIAAMAGRPSRRRRASRSRWTRRTTTCTSRCSSARSRPTDSSTSSGRRLARSRRQPWSPYIPGNDKKKGRAGRQVKQSQAPQPRLTAAPLASLGSEEADPGESMRTTWITALRMAAEHRPALAAIDPALLKPLASDDSDAKIAAIRRWRGGARRGAAGAQGDGRRLAGAGRRARGDRRWRARLDAASNTEIKPAPEVTETIGINNRVRRELSSTLAALRLFSSERAKCAGRRRRKWHSSADAEMLPLLEKALAVETDAEIKATSATGACAGQPRFERRRRSPCRRAPARRKQRSQSSGSCCCR
jgi:urea transport system substrate-binding protein